MVVDIMYLYGTLTSVAIRAQPISAVSVTWMGIPLRCAPPPRTAVNSSSLMGFRTTPTTTWYQILFYMLLFLRKNIINMISILCI